MAWRRRREDAENPAWPGLVDVFGFTLAFLLLLWFAANWPEKVKDLEQKNQDLDARIASINAEKRQLQGLNRSLEEKLLLQGQSNLSLTDQLQQLTENNKNLDAQLKLLQTNNLDLNGKVQQLTNEKAALREIGLKDWEDLLKLLQARIGKAHMTIIPNRNDKEITLKGKPQVTFQTTRYELSPEDKHRLQLLAPILNELRQKKKFFITINGTADPREL
ncbi:MAG: hypothetical protein M1438_09140, partial [Deltaproteobacteria bacterium]|nr:hypothetical protein [Deltaproteobacteria bacterium]